MSYDVEYADKAHYYRGNLINKFSGFEKAVEYFIGNYFMAGNLKLNEMMNVLLDRMTFESKRTAFKAILDKKELDKGFIKTKNNSFHHSEFFNEIRLLNDQRNYFAHYVLVISSEAKDKIIGLAEFRDSMNIIWYSLPEYNAIIHRVYTVTEKVRKLTDELLKST
ncbi:MAG TPA: hypothetical protein VK668_01845 [Mucilaginibacter sp.]|nr:hypothetical protein [Mucilaginibacter sp.]